MKISFFGHFGTLNTGNEGTLLAVLARLRSRSPEWELCCICTNPDSVLARDGIQAVPISARDIRIWDREVRIDRRVLAALVGLAAEAKEYVRAYRTLAGTEMLIVPGTGLLTDAHGLSEWGPYNLFKWSLMARLRGCSVRFVSVGAGPLYGMLGRAFVKGALSLADYRSYRDESSVEYLNGIGFRTKDDPVYPDLVFGLPHGALTQSAANGRRRRVVGLGLMVYPGRLSVANPLDETYTRYLQSLAAFVEWLLARDYDVRLLLGDGDAVVVEEFKSALRERVGLYDDERVIGHPIITVDQVLSELAATDVVVATRFHNVLFALLLNKPTIAISFHHKCASLMRRMGLSEYCHDIHDMDVHRLIAQFQQLEAHRDDVREMIRRTVDESRRTLDEQYDRLFAAA